MVSGLGLAIHFAFTPPASGEENPAVDAERVQVSKRDLIAAAAMMKTYPEAAKGGTPSLGDVPTITIPRATSNGAEGVPAGYPHTPEGAAGQLSNILWSVLSSMDLAHARRVQAAWFKDPHPADVWPVMVLIQEFLRAGQLADGLEPGASLRVEPVAAQIKGSDGADWHVALRVGGDHLHISGSGTDGVRALRTHGLDGAAVGDRGGVASGACPVDVAGHRPGGAGRVAQLGGGLSGVGRHL